MLKYILILAVFASIFNFSNSIDFQEILDIRLETIKFQIRSKLGLSTLPNISKHTIPPNIPPLKQWLASKSLSRGISKQADLETDDHRAEAKIERIITFAEPVATHVRGDRPKCCYFKFSPKTSRMKVARARQWVYVKTTGHRSAGRNRTARINLYKYTYPFRQGSPNRTLIASRNIRLSQGWNRFKVKNIVAEWFRDPSTNNGFDVQIEDANASIIQPGEDAALQPFIEVYVKDREDKHRIRRGASTCDPAAKQKNCCLYNLTVDFKSINWNWIIAPQRFDANFCAGDCPAFYKHGRHIPLIQRIQRDYKPCCSPSKMSSITVLYFDDKSNLLVGEIPGIVTNSCSCS